MASISISTIKNWSGRQTTIEFKGILQISRDTTLNSGSALQKAFREIGLRMGEGGEIRRNKPQTHWFQEHDIYRIQPEELLCTITLRGRLESR